MILNDNLYKVISKNEEAQSFTVEFMPESVIYQAHFPEQPITPGVCIIQIASELLAHLLKCNIELVTIGNAKFLAVINPNETPKATYVFKKIEEQEDGKIKVSVVVENNGIIYTKLSLVYKKND